jgi:PAS domain S-box-containing protein
MSLGLREASEERSVQIVEFATDAIISKDRAGLITSWNRGAERLYGFSAAEVLGRPVTLLIPEERKGEEWRLLLRVLGGEHIEFYETARRRKDASVIRVSLTLFALRDDSGEIIGAASIAHDISRQVAAERGLRNAEGRYRQILESAEEGIWYVDGQMITEYVNPSIAKMLGYAVEEMLGRPLADFVSERELAVALASIERQNQGIHEQMDVSLLRSDGVELPAIVSVNQVLDEAGEHSGNLAIVTDVSKQRQAETSLRQTESFLEGVSASMDEGLLTLDAHGRIATVNSAARRALGCDAQDLIGRTICDGLGCGAGPGGPCVPERCRLRTIDASTVPLQIDDEVFIRKDGARLPVSLSAAPLGDEGSGPSGHVVVFHDITESKQASEKAQRELDEMSWIGRLRDAIDEGRLVLAGQPIVSVATGAVCGQELLLRLRDRYGTLVMPGEFLPAAERLA